MEHMNKKIKKGGIDTIIAYVVVAIPLFYVLIFMVATLFHFAVQMHVNQVVKEVLIMASSYGELTPGMITWLNDELDGFGSDEWQVSVAKRELDNNGNVGGYSPEGGANPADIDLELKKGDLLVMEVRSKELSVLGTVSTFGMFSDGAAQQTGLHYSALREEIIRNDPR